MTSTGLHPRIADSAASGSQIAAPSGDRARRPDLERSLGETRFPGLADPAERDRFLMELERNVRLKGAERDLTGDADHDLLRRPNLEDCGWDARRGVAAWAASGDLEEATWLAFLVVFFGETNPDRADRSPAVRAVYTGSGDGHLLWEAVAARPSLVAETCRRHREQYEALPRGNHRKFEAKGVDHPRGILPAVDSYLALVRSKGDGVQRRFFAAADTTPERRFARLMRELSIFRFRRLANFDLLCLLGNLGVYELRPGRLHLSGASGPKSGALRLCEESAHRVEQVDDRLSAWARKSGIALDAFEDTLCNWQKGPLAAGGRHAAGCP